MARPDDTCLEAGRTWLRPDPRAGPARLDDPDDAPEEDDGPDQGTLDRDEIK